MKKVKICSNKIIILIVILFISCDKSNEKTKNDEFLIFSYHRGGGWNGLIEDLEIKADSTHYSISYLESFDARKIKSYQTTIKTSDKQWNYLTRTFNLENFSKIKDGRCRACGDGYDEMFSVTKIDTTYSIYNGDADKHFLLMRGFFNSILKQTESFERIADFRQ